ncbi:MAG TPA: sigma-70 family RNA polymerase sigma factor [Thermoanaerobaculia bacterium]
MNDSGLFEAHLPDIERAIAAICAHASLRGADAEDFASTVKVALLENDCAILRKWEGRSTFATWITVVVRRMLVDQRRASGRFFPSETARQRGEAAVRLEQLMVRDRRGVEEAIEIVCRAFPGHSRRDLAEIAKALPERTPRPQLVAITEEDAVRFEAPDAATDGASALDRARRSRAASRVVQHAMQSLTSEDRLILRLRFGHGQSIADIARALAVQQRPLYRRVESILAVLRRALRAEGLDAAHVSDLIGVGGEWLDFQLDGKSDEREPSIFRTGSDGGS